MDSMNPLLASGWHYFFGILMFVTSVFLILLVLVQRGRGGGLAGAFGGMGGQSAFGTKAGDLFTRLTMGAATFWIVLCVMAIWVLNRQESVFGEPTGSPTSGFEALDDDPNSVADPLGDLLPADTDTLPAEATGTNPPADGGEPPTDSGNVDPE